MKFNSLDHDNDRKQDIAKWVMIALVMAVVCYFVLNVAGALIVALSKIMFKYWYAAIILILIIIFFKRKGRKKK